MFAEQLFSFRDRSCRTWATANSTAPEFLKIRSDNFLLPKILQWIGCNSVLDLSPTYKGELITELKINICLNDLIAFVTSRM